MSTQSPQHLAIQKRKRKATLRTQNNFYSACNNYQGWCANNGILVRHTMDPKRIEEFINIAATVSGAVKMVAIKERLTNREIRRIHLKTGVAGVTHRLRPRAILYTRRSA